MTPTWGTDPYAVLGVAPDATAAELDQAFRALVRRHHPDTRPGDAATGAFDDRRLREVIAAYAVLRDPATRLAYDRGRRAERIPIPVTRRGRPSPREPDLRFGPVRRLR
jgi:curved DNA-binding protein CbpA